mgnify:CR=1 FL=1
MVCPREQQPKRLTLVARLLVVLVLALVVGLVFAVGLVWLITPEPPGG